MLITVKTLKYNSIGTVLWQTSGRQLLLSAGTKSPRLSDGASQTKHATKTLENSNAQSGLHVGHKDAAVRYKGNSRQQ